MTKYTKYLRDLQKKQGKASVPPTVPYAPTPGAASCGVGQAPSEALSPAEDVVSSMREAFKADPFLKEAAMHADMIRRSGIGRKWRQYWQEDLPDGTNNP